AEDGIRDFHVTGVQTCALPILEPRVFWVNSPYQENQHQIPNFDSAAITVTYASLFTGERFTGDDRLADLDQVSAGVTSRFIRGEIGRASCRERVAIWEGGGDVR